MPRECSCQGSNDNCSRCYGSGFLSGNSPPQSKPRATPRDDRIVNQGSPLKGHWKGMILDRQPQREAEPRRAESMQQVSASPVPLPGFPVGRAGQNNFQGTEQRMTPSPIRQPSLERCGFCNKAVVPGGLPRHQYEAHGIGRRPQKQRLPGSHPTQISVGSSPGPPLGLYQCPFCPAVFKRKNRKKHIRKVHSSLEQQTQRRSGGRSNTTSNKRLTRTTRANPETNSRGNDWLPGEKSNHEEERRLDGARDYFQLRDHGQFGSHSTYEDYSDESAP
jgi:hypothetical protein